ncbi:hypothetical protein TNCV_866381 [Trichonephila clavipes]|nr:hypothetical protein TNCV_866381 [Trichonephila clavipes]
MILHVGYRSFSGYFLDDKQYHSRARSVGVYNPMTDRTYCHLRIVRMPCPVQSNCDAHDTIANGQYGAVWSMGHTQQVCVRIVLICAMDNPSAVLRVEQSTQTSHPVRNVRLKDTRENK